MGDIYYRHLRKERFSFITNEATLASVVTEEGVVQVGISVCSSADQFNKKVGRDAAEARANFKPIYSIKKHADTTDIEACKNGIQVVTALFFSNEDAILRKLQILGKKQ